MAMTRKPLRGEEAHPARLDPVVAQRWRRSRGSAAPARPAPSSMKASRTPSESKVCTRAPMLSARGRLRRHPPLSSAAASGYRRRRHSHSRHRAAHMAASLVPHFANDQGVEKISIGVKEFQCMGARPPHDHPHVYPRHGRRRARSCAPIARRFTCTMRAWRPTRPSRRAAW